MTDTSTTDQDFMDFVATMAHDYGGEEQTYNITEPAGGWVRSYNALAPDTFLVLLSVASTFGTELFGTSNTYTVVPAGFETTFDSSTATIFEARDLLSALISVAKVDGVVG